MEKFNVQNNDFVQEENANSESEIISDNISNDEEKNENNYDQPASQEEISGLRKEIEKEVGDKANELNISKERLIELTDLDLESLEKENLESLDLNRGGLEFIKDSIDEAINEFWRSEKTGKLVTGTTSKLEGSINEAFEFAKKHKKIVSLGELALYASSFGPAVLKDLAGDDVQVEIGEQKISLKDLADNPELVNEIEQSKNANSPIEIGQEYFSDPFIHEGVAVEFKVTSSSDERGNVINEMSFTYQGLNYGNAEKNQETFKKLGVDLNNLGFNKFDRINLDTFEKNQEKIAGIISADINAPKEDILNYIDSILKINSSKISMVEFDKWEINKDLEFKNEIIEKYEEISNKYNTSIPEERNEAIDEFEKWGKDNGYENIWASLDDTNLIHSASIREAIKGSVLRTPADLREKISQGQLMEEEKGFENYLIQMLNEEGYSINELKEIAEDNPKEIFTILAEIIGKNVEYDHEKSGLISAKKYDEIERQTPYDTLKTGKGVCNDYAELLAKGKSFLESEGVPNLNKTVVLVTTQEFGNVGHAWNTLITVDKDGKLIITSIDVTWADDDKEENVSKISEKLNAVDDKHYYTGIIKKVNETHNKALDKIKDYNILAFQEKLKEVLTQYDPKLHKREREIEGGKELREQDKNVELTREEKTRNVKKSLKSVKNKLKRIYAKKDSENE